MARNIVHVVGTGTVGAPLIGILSSRCKNSGVEEVTFQPDPTEIRNIALLKGLVSHGAKLAIPEEHIDEFASVGCKVDYQAAEAIDRAGVVIDCSVAGTAMKNKLSVYSQHIGKEKLFIAQSRDPGFGKDYAFGINDESLDRERDQFIRIVSCNAHNISSIVKTLAIENHHSNLEWGRFVCIRRASDISEEKNFIPSPMVGIHKDEKYGTYQAADATALFKSIGFDLDLFSSAMRVNSQYLHIIHFDLKLTTNTTIQNVINRLQANPLIALTNKSLSSQVFSFARDLGYLGRILNQSVVAVPTLYVLNQNEVSGFCFSLQDGNSLLSSIAAAVWYFFPKSYKEKIAELNDLIFAEI
jgi:glyceraldehyde-3-phosphate dehydrogenase/erythrose-4-phosphate dehydrogenase